MVGVPPAEAGDSAELAAAKDEEGTAIAPQSGPFPPSVWRGQEDDFNGEPEKGAKPLLRSAAASD